MSVQQTTKIVIMAKAFVCLQALGSRAAMSVVEDVVTTFLDLLLSDNAETQVPGVILEFLKTREVSQNASVLGFIQAKAAKIQSATQANLIAEMLPSDTDQAVKTVIGEAVQRTLLQQNFQSTTNYGQLLALTKFLNTKLDRLAAVFNQEPAVANWLIGGKSVVS